MVVRRAIRVLLAEDHTLLRAGLRQLIDGEPDMEVIGEAGDGFEAVELAAALEPDVVVLDITMPRLNGLLAARRIRDRGLSCRLLFLTVHAEQHYIRQAFAAGGTGYVLKRAVDVELMEAIRVVHRGGTFLFPEAVQALIEAYRDDTEGAGPPLTERQRTVLTLTVEGFSDREIAEHLQVSVKTVDGARRRIMEKLGAHHRSELVRYALQHGLLS